MNSVTQRAIVAFAIAIFYIGTAWLGGWWFFAPIVILFAIAAIEFSEIAKNLDLRVSSYLLLPALLAHWTAVQFGQYENETLFLGMMLALLNALWQYERSGRERAGLDLVMTIAGLMLFGWAGSHLLKLRAFAPESGSEAWQWVILAGCSIWMVDFFAYVVGRFIAGQGGLGRHRLSPRLSPNKTIEGFVGGCLLGILLAAGIGIGYFGLPAQSVLLFSSIVAIFSPAGDLLISMLKRTADVKDTGSLLPGHGGALDRVDSLLIGAPIAWYVLQLLV